MEERWKWLEWLDEQAVWQHMFKGKTGTITECSCSYQYQSVQWLRTKHTTRGRWCAQTKTNWLIYWTSTWKQTYNTRLCSSLCFPAWGGLGFRLTNLECRSVRKAPHMSTVKPTSDRKQDELTYSMCVTFAHEAPDEGAQKRKKRRKMWPSPCCRRWSKEGQDGSMVPEEH